MKKVVIGLIKLVISSKETEKKSQINMSANKHQERKKESERRQSWEGGVWLFQVKLKIT